MQVARRNERERFDEATKHLVVISVGLIGTFVGAFDDDRLAEVLSLPDGRRPMYLLPMGHPPK